jgi:hypothetical protein
MVDELQPDAQHVFHLGERRGFSDLTDDKDDVKVPHASDAAVHPGHASKWRSGLSCEQYMQFIQHSTVSLPRAKTSTLTFYKTSK